MQPCLVANRWVANGREKWTAGAQAKRGASGDRLFFSECARPQALEKQKDVKVLAQPKFINLRGVAGCPR